MCDPILVPLLKMRPHYSQSSRENATPSSGTSPLASYKEVPPPGQYDLRTRRQLLLMQVSLLFHTCMLLNMFIILVSLDF